MREYIRYRMNRVNNEIHNACSQVTSSNHFVNASSNRKKIMGPNCVRKLAPPPSRRSLNAATAPPIALRTNIIALTTIGRRKTATNAKRSIINFLSEDFVLDTTTLTEIYIIRKTITVATINQSMKKRASSA
jgi:hypothetical protein